MFTVTFAGYFAGETLLGWKENCMLWGWVNTIFPYCDCLSKSHTVLRLPSLTLSDGVPSYLDSTHTHPEYENVLIKKRWGFISHGSLIMTKYVSRPDFDQYLPLNLENIWISVSFHFIIDSILFRGILGSVCIWNGEQTQSKSCENCL